jgi:beta-glucosidase/6-phospho-beta-glucosidase/beta-galactosidase
MNDMHRKAQAAPVMIIPDSSATGEAAAPTEMTEEQRMAVQVAIANAATLEEVHRLESALKVGCMPELPEAELHEKDAAAMEEG